MNNYKLLTHAGLTLEYTSFGQGPETLLCFHGFGRSAEDFVALENQLSNRYTVHAFNLFFHGNSVFPQHRIRKKPWLKSELHGLIVKLKEQENFQQFSLMGYSLGGKIALCICELFPEFVQELVLVSPDGFKANPWYHFISQNPIGQQLHFWSINRPWIFTTFAKVSAWTKLSTPRQARFAKSQMENPDKRVKIYSIWMTHRALRPDLKSIKHVIIKHNIRTEIVAGKYETIVPLQPLQDFTSNLKGNGTFTLLASGHDVSLSETVRIIWADT